MVALMWSCKKDDTSINVPTNPNLPTRPVLLLDDTSYTGDYVVRWYRSLRALSYTVEEDQEPTYQNANVIYTGFDTMVVVTGRLSGQVFYYRVKANNNEGSSDWSATTSIVVLVNLPTAPTLYGPDSSGTGVFTLRWTRPHLSANFTLQEDSNTTFQNAATIYDGSDSVIILQRQRLGFYYYRVRAHNSQGVGGWSNIKSVFNTSPATVVFPTSNVHYGAHVQQLFRETCTLSGCHDGSGSQLDLTTYGALMSIPGIVVPGDPENSQLVWRIEGRPGGNRMPLNMNPLNQNQINGIRMWIAEGALNN